MLGRRLASEAQPGPGRRIERRLLSEAAFGVLFVVESGVGGCLQGAALRSHRSPGWTQGAAAVQFAWSVKPAAERPRQAAGPGNSHKTVGRGSVAQPGPQAPLA